MARRMYDKNAIKKIGGGGGSMETVDTIISIDDGFKVTYADGSTLDLPIKAGAGISADVSEDGYYVEIKSEGGGGGTLYDHNIYITNYTEAIGFHIINSNPQSYNHETLKTYLFSLAPYQLYPCSGSISNNGTEEPVVAFKVEQVMSYLSFTLYQASPSSITSIILQDDTQLSDTVIEI